MSGKRRRARHERWSTCGRRVGVGARWQCSRAQSSHRESTMGATSRQRSRRLRWCALRTSLPADGAPGRGVYVQKTRTGHLCVWEAPSATSRERGGGCNTADDPLERASGLVHARLRRRSCGQRRQECDALRPRYVGGRAGARADERRKRAGDSAAEGQGRRRRTIRAFGYRFKKADLRKGIGPTAVVAHRRERSARSTGRPTGIGG